jgi:hypothetical protein
MDYDITVYQGSTFKMMLTIKDPLDAPIDLTGYIFSGQIRKTYSSSVIEASFEFEVQTQSGATLGQVLCTITAEETAGINVSDACGQSRKITKMVYDIESQVGTEVTRWLQGVANISPEVTK